MADGMSEIGELVRERMEIAKWKLRERDDAFVRQYRLEGLHENLRSVASDPAIWAEVPEEENLNPVGLEYWISGHA